jgi:hypothetical protein
LKRFIFSHMWANGNLFKLAFKNFKAHFVHFLSQTWNKPVLQIALVSIIMSFVTTIWALRICIATVLATIYFCACLWFWDTFSLYSPGCPWTPNPPASASQVLGLHVYPTTPNLQSI